jgi:hypothetical protein
MEVVYKMYCSRLITCGLAGCTTAFRRSAPIDLQGGSARRPLRGTAANSPTTTRRAARIRRERPARLWRLHLIVHLDLH